MTETQEQPRERVRFRDGEVVKVKNERINEIRPLVAGIWYALHGFRPGEAFIKTRAHT